MRWQNYNHTACNPKNYAPQNSTFAPTPPQRRNDDVLRAKMRSIVDQPQLVLILFIISFAMRHKILKQHYVSFHLNMEGKKKPYNRQYVFYIHS